MKKPVRLTIWGLGGGVLLIALFTLAVNLYVQSAGVQFKIRKALGDAIQMPVSVFRASYTPWGGFSLSGIQIHDSNHPGKTQKPFLKAASVQVHCQWLPLFSGKLVINQLTVRQPVLTWQQNEDGDWELPKADEGKQHTQPAAAETAPESTPKTVAPQAMPLASAPPSTESAPLPSQERDAAVRKITLENGTLLFVDKVGREIAQLDGLRLTADAGVQPGDFDGKLWIKRLLLRERYEITAFNSPVIISGGSIDVPRIEGVFAKGKVKGSVRLQTDEPGTPFSLKLKISKASLATICTTDADIASRIKGTVKGEIELAGLGSRSRSNQGTGDFEIKDGSFEQYPLLQTIGQILRVDELETVALQGASMRIGIHDSVVHVQPLDIQSQNLRLNVTGTIRPDQKLNLNARLFINEKAWKRLPSEARENFVQIPEREERALDFKVHGDLSQPQTDLVKRLIGKKLQKRFQSLIGGLLEDQPDEGTATPEPQPSTPAAKSTP